MAMTFIFLNYDLMHKLFIEHRYGLNRIMSHEGFLNYLVKTPYDGEKLI